MRVDVCLPSGAGCSIAVSPETLVRELKAAAEQHFQRRLKLIAKGEQLDLAATVSEAGLGAGDMVAAVAQIGQLAATSVAFAWHGHGCECVTWGVADSGGDSSQVQEQLRNVQHIQSTSSPFGGAFAAILESGAVVTWGHARGGGDSSQVQEQLRNVQRIQSTSSSFGCALAAILKSGAVVT